MGINDNLNGKTDSSISKKNNNGEYSSQPNVKEEKDGTLWAPKGGEFVVLSLLPDDFDGAVHEQSTIDQASDKEERKAAKKAAKKSRKNTGTHESNSREAALNERVARDLTDLLFERAGTGEFSALNGAIEELLEPGNTEIEDRLVAFHESRERELRDEA